MKNYITIDCFRRKSSTSRNEKIEVDWIMIAVDLFSLIKTETVAQYSDKHLYDFILQVHAETSISTFMLDRARATKDFINRLDDLKKTDISIVFGDCSHIERFIHDLK